MTVGGIKSAGASSADYADWHEIPWQKAEKFVHRLQVRIAKAYREGNHGRVKSLQWLLTHSFYAKALAVKRVTQNKGGKTPGIDNITWNTDLQKMNAIKSLKRKGYKASPLKRILIPKRQKGKLRPLSIPVMHCRAMQALYALALAPVAETVADKNAYGFRPFRSAEDAIERCFKIFCHKGSATYVLEADIKSCFDKISHQWLLENIAIDKEILKKWLMAGYVQNGILHSTQEGTPQGGIISPMLLNITLSGMEKMLNKGRTRPQNKVHISVYADDFIVSGKDKETLENEVKPKIEEFLKVRGLALSKEKTKITHIDDGFNFLGTNIRKHNNKLIIRPSKESVSSFLNEIRATIKENPTMSAEKLIYLLNPKIRGWLNYFRSTCAKSTFSKVSHFIFKALWEWAKRRHYNKGFKWIKNKYFRSTRARNWVFSAKVKNKDGTTKWLELIEPTRIRIIRHKKIRCEAHPFDPQFKTYLKDRRNMRLKMMFDEITARKSNKLGHDKWLY